jgi:hypothetical protein
VPKAHVILVATHLDRAPNRQSQIDHVKGKFERLKAEYPTLNFLTYAAVSCSTGEGIDFLRRDIEFALRVIFPFLGLKSFLLSPNGD